MDGMSPTEGKVGHTPPLWRRYIGVTLVLLSGVWFACIFLVAYTGLPLATKVFLGGVFFVLMEGTFYLGLALAGKQLLSRYWGSVKRVLKGRRRPTNKDPAG